MTISIQVSTLVVLLLTSCGPRDGAMTWSDRPTPPDAEELQPTPEPIEEDGPVPTPVDNDPVIGCHCKHKGGKCVRH